MKVSVSLIIVRLHAYLMKVILSLRCADEQNLLALHQDSCTQHLIPQLWSGECILINYQIVKGVPSNVVGALPTEECDCAAKAADD